MGRATYACILLLHPVAIMGMLIDGWNRPSMRGEVTVELDGLGSEQWHVSCHNASAAATVPGDVYTDLQRAAIIGDPLYRFNDLAYAWVGNANWTYALSFNAPASLCALDMILLVLDGVETEGTVWLNGVEVGVIQDEWLRYIFSVKQHLDCSTGAANRLTIALRNESTANPRWIRQDQSGWGWDWCPALVPQGIWRPVSLVGYDHVAVSTLSPVALPTSDFVVNVTLVMLASRSMEVDVKLSLENGGDEPTLHHVALAAGENALSLTHNVTGVSLWWPLDYGDRPMYTLTAGVTGDGFNVSESRRMGFRSVALITHGGKKPVGPGSGKSSFWFEVNGRPVLCKGADIVPLDMFNGRTGAAATARMLSSVAEARMNMIRVWGGGTYFPQLFYELCDEMVSEPPFAACRCHCPHSPTFLSLVGMEVRRKVLEMRHHPSIVLWSGNNEDNCDLYGKNASSADYQACLDLYFGCVMPAAAASDNSRPLVPSCPSAGFSGGVDPTTGRPDGTVLLPFPPDTPKLDTHGPYGCMVPAGTLINMNSHFRTEFGCLSLPSLETLKSATDGSEGDWSVFSPVMIHRKHSGGDIVHAVLPNFYVSEMTYNSTDEADYIWVSYLSMVSQMECIRAAVDEGRRGGTDGTMGYVLWQLNDVWGASSWGSLEYGGRWKPLHHMLHRVFSLLYVRCNVDMDFTHVNCTVVNDGPTSVMGTVAVHGTTYSEARWNGPPSFQTPLNVDSGSAVTFFRGGVGDMCPGNHKNSCVVWARFVPSPDSTWASVFDGDDDPLVSVAWMHRLYDAVIPHQDVPQPVVEDMGEDGAEVTVTVKRFTPYVWLSTESAGRFSSNGFHAFPDAPRSLRFFPFPEVAPFDFEQFRSSLRVMTLSMRSMHRP